MQLLCPESVNYDASLVQEKAEFGGEENKSNELIDGNARGGRTMRKKSTMRRHAHIMWDSSMYNQLMNNEVCARGEAPTPRYLYINLTFINRFLGKRKNWQT